MRRLSMATICLGIALLGWPAMAAEGDGGSFFVGVEAKFMKPSGMQNQFVLVDPNDNGIPEGEIESMDLSYELAPAVFLGWMTGSEGHFYLRVWNYEQDDSETIASPASGELWDIRYHADDALEDFTGTSAAALDVEAMTFDAGYARTVVKTDRFKSQFSAGLRYASLDWDLDVRNDDLFDPNNMHMESETSGVGVAGGLKGSFMLAEGWYIMGGAQYAMMMGEADGSTAMYYDTDCPTLPGPCPGTFVDGDANVRGDEDRVISTFDVSLGVVWSISETFHLGLSYELSQWNNVLYTHDFPDDVNEGFIDTESSDVTWDGFTLAAAFVF